MDNALGELRCQLRCTDDQAVDQYINSFGHRSCQKLERSAALLQVPRVCLHVYQEYESAGLSLQPLQARAIAACITALVHISVLHEGIRSVIQ